MAIIPGGLVTIPNPDELKNLYLLWLWIECFLCLYVKPVYKTINQPSKSTSPPKMDKGLKTPITIFVTSSVAIK